MAKRKAPELNAEIQAANAAGETMNNKKPLSWTDIEIALKNSIQNSPGETDAEKLA
jgi:hypothetical protein